MAIQAGVGFSIAKDHIQAAKEATLKAHIKIQAEKIDLAFVFTSLEFAHPLVFKTISDLLGPIPILGCSSLAVIGNDGIFKHGLVVMLLSLPEGAYFNSACVTQLSLKSPRGAGEELGEKLLYGCKGVRRDLSLTFFDGLIPDGSEILFGLEEKLGMSFPVVGGSASDNLSFNKTYLYFNGEVLNDAICGLLFGGKLYFGLGIKHGWKPLGKPRQITKSKGNLVEEIDNAPAVKIYQEYLSKDIPELRGELKHLAMLYPIGISIPEEEYLLRNILEIKDDGSLVFQGNVPEGSTIRLMIATKESCLQATQQAVEEAKKNLMGHNINFVLVFNSISRYILLGRQAPEELGIIKRALGAHIPLVGIYTYAEQAPLRAMSYLGKSYFHNQTITILGMGG